MWRCSELLLNWVRTKMRRRSELRQLLIGMSTSRYFPPRGTAGLARSLVSGKSRVPAPPPSTTLTTSCGRMVEVQAVPRSRLAHRAAAAHAMLPPGLDLTAAPRAKHDGLILPAVRAEMDRAADRQSPAAVGASGGRLGLRDRLRIGLGRVLIVQLGEGVQSGDLGQRGGLGLELRIGRIEHPREGLGAERNQHRLERV